MDKELVIRRLDLKDLIRLNINCIHFFGYFNPESEVSTTYYIYAAMFVGFWYILSLLSQFANMVAVFGDIEKMTEASFLLLTNLVQALKIYCFMRQAPRVRNLMNSIDRPEFRPQNWTQCEILLDDIKMSQIITKVFLFMCCVTCSLWGIFPFLDKSADEAIRLPLSGWYPFKTDKSPMFELVYVYQTLSTLVNGLGNISMDTFLSGSIMVISGQLGVLNNAFHILKQKYETKTGAQVEVREGLIRNVVHYRHIIQFAEELTSLFNTCITGQFVVSVIVICMTMFQMSLVSVLSLQFLSMMLYQACILLEIFLWCYYGNEVMLKSGKLTESAYMCKWIDCSEEFKQNLLIFMTRSQISLKLHAGGYFTLSIDTFMAIAKSSWSYFAVLNRVHSGEAL